MGYYVMWGKEGRLPDVCRPMSTLEQMKRILKSAKTPAYIVEKMVKHITRDVMHVRVSPQSDFYDHTERVPSKKPGDYVRVIQIFPKYELESLSEFYREYKEPFDSEPLNGSSLPEDTDDFMDQEESDEESLGGVV